MTYYVKTGDIDTKMCARTPRQAAIQAIRYSKETSGICVIVSEQEIREEYSDSHFYFMTDSIMEECLSMRVVG